MRISVILLLLAMLYACGVPKNNSKAIQRMQFLKGNWEFEEAGVRFNETWIQNNDSVLYGRSVLCLTKDTLFSESIYIEPLNGRIYYRSSVGLYVVENTRTLPLTSLSSRNVVFSSKIAGENIYVHYRKKGKNLLIEMRDVIDGEVIHEKYTMKKRS